MRPLIFLTLFLCSCTHGEKKPESLDSDLEDLEAEITLMNLEDNE